jgi:hypothetical protein
MILPLCECWGKALSEPRERRALKIMVHLPVPDFTPGSLGLAAGPHPRFRRPRRRPGAWAWLPLFGPRLWTPHQQRHLSGNVGQNLRVQAPAFRIPHSHTFGYISRTNHPSALSCFLTVFLGLLRLCPSPGPKRPISLTQEHVLTPVQPFP